MGSISNMYDFPILRELGANPKGIDWAGRQTEVFDGPTTDISTNSKPLFEHKLTQNSLLLTSKRASRMISQSFKTLSEKLGHFHRF